MANRTPILMLLAIAVLGIYVLPSVTARFAGSHSMELNQTGRVSSLDCEKCHNYIIGELGATGSAVGVLAAHRMAAGQATYVNGSGILNITESEALDSSVNRSACMLCHLISRNTTRGLNVTHTKITIRVCTDVQCHGASVEGSGEYMSAGGVNMSASNVSADGVTEDRTAPWATDALNVTTKLALPEDVHSKFYTPLDAVDSQYIAQDGTAYSKGFYACLACHTHVGVSFNLSRPVMIGFNMTANLTGSPGGDMNMTGFVFETSWNNGTTVVTEAQKLPAGVWS